MNIEIIFEKGEMSSVIVGGKAVGLVRNWLTQFD